MELINFILACGTREMKSLLPSGKWRIMDISQLNFIATEESSIWFSQYGPLFLNPELREIVNISISLENPCAHGEAGTGKTRSPLRWRGL